MTVTVVFLIVAMLQSPQNTDIAQTLELAESLYYRARFADSRRLIEELEPRMAGATIELRARARLLGALNALAANDAAVAMIRFREMVELNASASLSPDDHAPKVIDAFNEARQAVLRDRCQAGCDACATALGNGRPVDAATAIQPYIPDCECARTESARVAGALQREGDAASTGGRHADSLRFFRTALLLRPDDAELRTGLETAAGRVAGARLEAMQLWRTRFEARDFSAADNAYARLLELVSGDTADEPAAVRRDYERALDRTVRLWNQACAREDALTMDALRHQARSMDPRRRFSGTALRTMKSCPVDCREVDSAEALALLRHRVDPAIDRTLRFVPKIAVRLRIAADGTVRVTDIDNPGGDPSVSRIVLSTLDQWRFDRSLAAGATCTTTEFLVNFER